MIFIPAYWSFDYKRDLNWKEIQKLQKLRSISIAETEYEAKLRCVAAAMKKWEALDLRPNKIPFICQELGLSLETDEGTVRRWMRHAAKVV